MPRGPFQGTYQSGTRPTITTAPDALVYINGELDILGCHSCRRRFNWNKYITSIQVDLSVESSPGSASVSLSIPRHSVDEFYHDGNPLISPMMEIEIYAKGYYLIEGVPQYYPIFWGLVTEVSDNYSGGEHTLSINCADILKWWELCKMNINPAFTQAAGQAGKSIFGNVFFGVNPYDVIWTLAQQSFGDVVIGSGSLVSLYKENQQKSTFNAALSDLMQYWNQRFSKIRSNLLMYGTQGNAVRGDVLHSTYQKGVPQYDAKNPKSAFASQMVRQANGGDSGSQMVFDPTDPSVVAFRTQFMQAGQVNFWQSEYQTKLELANAAKEAIGYEFYMDVTGDIVFKPPFYNLDVLSNKPVSWIQDIDVIDWDLSLSEAEVVTQLTIQGSFGGNVDYGFSEDVTPFTSVTDYHLLRQYGWRSQTYNSEFLGSPLLMFYVGLDLLDRMNSKRFRGTVNIPLRPELRLGFPIYLAPKDQVWYIQGISHNIQFGGRAQTTLSLTAKRTKFMAPKGIGTIALSGYSGTADKKTSPTSTGQPTARQLAKSGQFKATVGDAAQIPPLNAPTSTTGNNPYEPLVLRHPKTGRVVGYPNVVMAYTRPFTASPDQLSDLQGKKRPGQSRAVQQYQKNVNKAVPQILSDLEQAYHTYTKADALRDKHLANRYTYGLTSAGVYTYMHDTSSVLKEMLLLPAKNIDFGESGSLIEGKNAQRTAMIRPVSDERGFEVIGHYKYGRNLSLRDGSLILNETADNPNTRATIDLQVALSGGMYEMLQAQSVGLASVSYGLKSPNPADAIARLQPDDLQTAGVINPQTGKPEFANTNNNFVDVAPLGSPEQKGVASVEASQFSRALTLAEMKVKDESVPADEACECLTGRADLAFINVGYQVQVLRSATTPDTTTIKYGAVSGDQIAAIDQALQEGRGLAQAEAEASVLISRTEAESAAASNRIIGEAIAELPPDVLTQGLIGEALQEGRPISNSALVNRDQFINTVENFLTTLYRALDTPHQEYEAALRGELLERKNPNQPSATDIRFAKSNDGGKFSPPFSAPNRALGGDLNALALQVSGAGADISKAWSDFGTKLQDNTKAAVLQAEITILERDLADLLEDLESAEGSEAEQLQAEADKLAQQIADKQHEIASIKQGA